MPIHLDDFLRRWWLRADPFAMLAAEQEHERLALTFYRSESFRQLASMIPDSRPLVVFGGAGLGKTATRRQLAREISAQHSPPLVVPIDGRTLLESAAPLSPEAHIILIAQQALLQLQAAWASPGLAQAAVGAQRPQAEGLPPSGRSLLRTIADMATGMRFSGVHVYFDCPSDSAPPGDLARVAALLRPLLDDPVLLSECGFTFRLFLPDSLHQLLAPQLSGNGLLRSFTLTYETSDLIEILRIRLADASRFTETSSEGYVERFASFFHRDDTGVDQQLAAAAGTPRRMFELAGLVIRRYCADVSDPRQPLTPELLYAVLLDHGATPAPAARGNGSPPPPPPPADERRAADDDPGVPKLTLQKDGRVFVGNLSINSLTKMLRRALVILWEHRGESITYRAFEQLLYDDGILRGDPKSAREHTIALLRQKLEPKNPDARRSRTYIDTLHGTGYSLRNYQPPQGGAAA